jgi:hypothetical protein
MSMLDEEEELYLNRIANVSRLDKATVLEVLRSILIICDKEIYSTVNTSNTGTIVIPMICKLDISYQDVNDGNRGVLADVKLRATAKKTLISEINCISEGEETTVQKTFKKHIKDAFKETVGLE